MSPVKRQREISGAHRDRGLRRGHCSHLGCRISFHSTKSVGVPMAPKHPPHPRLNHFSLKLGSCLWHSASVAKKPLPYCSLALILTSSNLIASLFSACCASTTLVSIFATLALASVSLASNARFQSYTMERILPSKPPIFNCLCRANRCWTACKEKGKAHEKGRQLANKGTV